MDTTYLYDLGYTSDEIDSFSDFFREEIINYLAKNADVVSENMKYLQKYFSKDILLKLSGFYCDAFTISSDLFKKRISLLRDSFPDNWNEIIEEQFWGYCGISGTNYKPFLSAVGSLRNEDVNDALNKLLHPETCVFEFMVMLSEKVGINVNPAWFDLEDLLRLEISKYEVVNNAKCLVNEGLSRDVILNIIECTPYLFMLSEHEVRDRLVKGFGNDYIKEMEKAYEIDEMDSILSQIGW